MVRTLLLEDDEGLSEEIRNFLIAQGISCDTVFDGSQALRQIKNNAYDFYLLDIDVPKYSGIDVCIKIRESNSLSPIIMLTAFGEIDDKAEAFKHGADDYLVKPFHLEELHLRIMALHRRRVIPQTPADFFKVYDLTIDMANRKAKRGETELGLTPKEFQLLHLLAAANGRVLSKAEIADRLWGNRMETSPNTIEVYINFLRNKIDRNFTVKLIHTKVGFGYYLKQEQ